MDVHQAQTMLEFSEANLPRIDWLEDPVSEKIGQKRGSEIHVHEFFERAHGSKHTRSMGRKKELGQDGTGTGQGPGPVKIRQHALELACMAEF